jgi:CheY-like chemotaxis protein/two-component sensor histidine kinase
VTQGKITLKKDRVDLRDVVTRALEGCRAQIQEHGQKLEVQLPESALPVEVDVIRVAQIVTNLLNNAAKFTGPGGVIQLVCEPSADGRAGLVCVRDNGRGIEPDMLPKIFDLFTQADPTDSRTQGGLGIGLTLARRLTEMHEGSLEASSKGLAQGSEFTLSLPLDPTRRELNRTGLQSSTRADSIQNPGRRILIVDDNQDSAASLATLLGLLGHEVHQANDGGRALKLAAEFMPDVMLLDIGMPGMNGYDLALAIKSQASLKEVPLIAISGYGGEEERRKTLSAGFHGHLVKPVELTSLQSMLASLPERHSEGH